MFRMRIGFRLGGRMAQLPEKDLPQTHVEVAPHGFDRLMQFRIESLATFQSVNLLEELQEFLRGFSVGLECSGVRLCHGAIIA